LRNKFLFRNDFSERLVDRLRDFDFFELSNTLGEVDILDNWELDVEFDFFIE